MRTPTELMDIVNVRMRDRPSGQPQSEESIDRERLLSTKAEAIAKLKALRVANEMLAPQAKPKRKKKVAT